MSRSRRRQVPKGARFDSRDRGRGSHIGQPDSLLHVQAQSIARRYARTDRSLRPLHCAAQGKLMYDTEEIALSTGEALQRLRGLTYTAYKCPSGSHWHLTTYGSGEAVNS